MEQRFTERARPWSVEDAAAVASDAFGVTGWATLLTGERDANFRIDTTDAAYVLKVTHPAEPMAVTRYQTAAHEHAGAQGAPVPHLHTARDGSTIAVVDRGDGPRAVRLIEHVPGTSMAMAPRTIGQRHTLGSALAKVDAAFATFTDAPPDLNLLWNSERVDGLAHLLEYIEGADRRELARTTLDHLVDETLPRLARQRRQLIHNDANPSNVLLDAADHDRVRAILDLGDVVIASLVQDVAVAAAYLVAPDAHPMAAPADLIAGFHAVLPLTDDELALVPDLMRARMLTTVLITEWRARVFPENRDYIMRNNPNAWAGLRRLQHCSADEALTVLRQRLEEDA